MRRLFNNTLLLALICFGAGDATGQQTFPYALGNDCYKLIEFEWFKFEETAGVWDLTRTNATGVEKPLIFKMRDDSTFTATTDNVRQTFRLSSSQWYLLKSEAMTSVADFERGVIVMGRGSDSIIMKGRTYQTDYYYGNGRTSHEIVGRGKLIRLPGDTIGNVTLDRRITALHLGISDKPTDTLEAIADTARVYSTTSVWTWRRATGEALAQAIERAYTNGREMMTAQSAAYLIINENNTVEYQHRQQSSGTTSPTSPTAIIGDGYITISGLEQDFDDTQITVSDISGRVYCHKVMNSGGGTVTIHTPLPPDQIVISIIQSSQTSLKLSR